MAKPKRVLALSDTHTMHRSGLVPAQWDPKPDPGAEPALKEQYVFRRDLWSWFLKEKSARGPYDLCLAVGDLVAGPSPRNAGRELLSSDLSRHISAAARILSLVGAAQTRIVYGTHYHVGVAGMDMEDLVAQQCGAPNPEPFFFADVGGRVFDVRHHVGSSSRAHTQFTAPAGEWVTSALEAERGLYPRADVILRAHRHKYCDCGTGDWRAMVLPCLSGATDYGARRCSGEPDVGFVVFDIGPGGEMSWEPVLADLPAQRYAVEKF